MIHKIKQNDLESVLKAVIDEKDRTFNSLYNSTQYLALEIATDTNLDSSFICEIEDKGVEVHASVLNLKPDLIAIKVYFTSIYKRDSIVLSEIRFSEIIDTVKTYLQEKFDITIGTYEIKCYNSAIYGDCNNMFSNLNARNIQLPCVSNLYTTTFEEYDNPFLMRQIAGKREPLCLDSFLENTKVDIMVTFTSETGNRRPTLSDMKSLRLGAFRLDLASSRKDVFKNFTILSVDYNDFMDVFDLNSPEVRNITIDTMEISERYLTEGFPGFSSFFPKVNYIFVHGVSSFIVKYRLKVDELSIEDLECFIDKFKTMGYILNNTPYRSGSSVFLYDDGVYRYIIQLFKLRYIEAKGLKSYDEFKKKAISHNLFKDTKNDTTPNFKELIEDLLNNSSSHESYFEGYEVPLALKDCHTVLSDFPVCFKAEPELIKEFKRTFKFEPYIFMLGKPIDFRSTVYNITTI